MAYQLIPNLILLVAILGIFILVLRRLPEATSLDDREEAAHARPQARLIAKGLPARAASRGKVAMKVGVNKVWHFMLEAKGLRQVPSVNYKIHKIWRRAPVTPLVPQAYDETHYLDQIKKAPKDLEQYNNLGQYYLDQKNYGEAKNVFDYLTKHSPANSDYLAKLGYSSLRLHDNARAIESYTKSLALDSSHPNRYYNLALAHAALNEPVAAAEALEKALALEQGNVKYVEMLKDMKEKSIKKS